MEMTKWKGKLPDFLKKYRYVLLVLLIGIAMMLIPENGSKASNIEPTQVTNVENSETLEKRLEDVLSSISGAGHVKVLLTQSFGEETIYQTNQDGGDGNRLVTVTVTDAQRNESGLVRQILSPKYRGAIIVCGGADDPVVCLAIKDAVSNATGLGTDRISVLKMN